MTPEDAVKLVESLAIFPGSLIRSHEPLFRQWDKIPASLRNRAKDLKSEDLEHVRVTPQPWWG